MKEGMMKAAVCRRYGDPEVLTLTEREIPLPRKDELQIAVKASAVTASDIFIRSSDVPIYMLIPMRLMIGITKPRRPVLGLVFAGVVEECGPEITRFKPGDRVYGMTGFRFGAYAEYLCLKEKDSKAGCISLLPDSIPFEESTAASYGGSLALQSLEKGSIKPGESVLIYGASGTSGTFAVQYAKHLGARVTAVCGPDNQEMAQSLGADEVLDYRSSDAVPDGSSYDFMLDSVGIFKSSPLKKACRKALKDPKRYASIDDGDLVLSSARLDQISRLVSEGTVRPVMDRTYPLEEIREAHYYVQKKHKKGGVAIRIAP